jgi:hypothetical protein
MSVIVILKNDVSYKTNDYQKLCDTNKNMHEINMIIKGVYHMSL